jgi:hypothetical protein
MNYQAFTNDSLTMMYEGIRGALASDDALKSQGDQPRFRVRDTAEWKQHASELASEMLKRGMFFEVIDWTEDQATRPFERWGLIPRSRARRFKPTGFLVANRGKKFRENVSARGVRWRDLPISDD